MLKKEIEKILNDNNVILFNYTVNKHNIKIVIDTIDGIDIKMITKISKQIKIQILLILNILKEWE